MIGERFAVRFLNALLRQPVPAAPSGLILGDQVGRSEQTIVLPDARRCEHVMVLGKTGVGKTHLLELTAMQVLERGEGLVFFDYHGDATEHLLALATNFP